MRIPDENIATYGPFLKGVNNRLPDEQLGTDMLRQAVNCALTDAGRLSQRPGYTIAANATNAHSMHASAYGLYYVDGVALKSYNSEAGVASVLRSDLTQDAPMAFLEVNGEIFYSNDNQRGKIVSGALRDWGVEIPAGIPNLALGTGLLEIGRREVLCTFVNAYGEESGAGLSTGITLSAIGGVSVSNLPQPASSEIVAINVYMTPHNGATFYQVRQVTVGTTSLLVTSLQPSIELASQFMAPPMPSRVLAYCGGRIYYASGRIVWYTEPMSYGRCRPSRNYMLFPADVTLMVGVRDGLYVAADKTYFLQGIDPDQMALTIALPYGAAFGSLAEIPITAYTWTWRSDRGQVLATNSGEVINMQEDQLALTPCGKGASLFMESDGGRQIVSVGEPSSSIRAEVSDFIEMEVRRKGA